MCITNMAGPFLGDYIGLVDVDARSVNTVVGNLNAKIASVVNQLNNTAGYAGRITFVDTASASVPHNCTGNTPGVTVNGVMFSAFNGIGPGNILSTATFHPTQAGQSMFAGKIEDAFSAFG
jgi:hypothetical protein